jgi:drug/metabolite transporter (DMT)-like permease
VSDPIAYLSLVGAVLIWGGSHLAIRVALDSFTPVALAVVRLILSAVCLGVYARWSGESLAVPRGDLLPLLGLGVLSHTVFQFLVNAALLFTTPAHAALMVSTMPTFAALAARGLLREGVSARRAGTILMAFVGVAIVILWSGQGLATARNPVLGDLLALGTAAAWALGSVLSKPFLGRYTVLKFSAVTLAGGALGALPFGAAAVARTSWEAVTGTGWLMLLYLTVGSIALATSLWNRGIAGVEVSRAAIFGNLIPVTTLGLSALLLGERITLPLLGGGALVVIGTYLTQRT